MHRCDSNHFGIIACTNNLNWEQFAARIDETVTPEEPLQGKLIRVVRPVT
ncbi:putative nuclease, containings PIN domain, potential toxin-antitoxin system component [Nostoc flagelliforme CCNUN1]|uniref:Putative nuclease, containings PIN domain, potential toxin-antitoxin system component n=1 Tax=Nostoc flagelliforme CCNUN1 TaxID=2038116 RepID=A0A2K8SWJ5_9NOSO|nr:putative nuclease, containings PIN domain, potential toxin-antitoxin system component [Nostoc flagelliforme CCNUN1]